MGNPKNAETMVFARVHPPRPLDPSTLEALLVRLASDPTQAPMVFEARSLLSPDSASAQVQYWMGATAPHLRWLRRTLHDLLPGLVIDTKPTALRRPVTAAARVKVRPRGLALVIDRPVEISTAILSALNQHLLADEELVVQMLFGPRRTPRHHRGRLADPSQPWWTLPTSGVLDAPGPIVRQHDQRALQAGMATCIRIGVTATDSDRRGRLLAGLLGGISTAKAPSTFISLRREATSHLHRARTPRVWEFAPAAAELVGLLAWPLGDSSLPGLPPRHPKLLPAPRTAPTTSTAITSTDPETKRVVGLSTVPGDPRPVVLSAHDSLFHSVTTGPTGAGKSTVMLGLIRADVDAGRPVVVIDPKWQLIRDIIDRAIPSDRVGDVVLLDPRDGHVPGFNPLDVGDRDPDVVVDGLLAVFAAVFADGWGPRTQDITHAGLSTLARAGASRAADRDPYTLLDLPRLFTDTTFRRSVIGHVAHDPALGSFWAAWESQPPGAQAAALAAPMNKWRQYLMRPSVRRILGQPRPVFRLRDVFRQKKILLVALNEGLIGPITAQLLGGLVVAEMWAATLERASEPHPEQHPASVWVDEVQNHLHLPTSLDDALNASRSMGVSWNLAHQFRSQMSPAMLAAVDSNARTKIVFRTSDPKDATAYARMTPDLEAIDFMSLGRYEAYTTVVTNGEQQPWCSIRTSAPPVPTGHGAQVRDRSQSQYGGSPRTDPGSEPAEADNATSPPTIVGRIRKGSQQ
ncbi:MAG: type IV secretory system conjugative DNA transfer family protein [Nocardioides sp.]